LLTSFAVVFIKNYAKTMPIFLKENFVYFSNSYKGLNNGIQKKKKKLWA